MRVQTLQGDTLDALCQRHLGATAGVVEAALELNRNLADYGPVLPQGLAVTLPQPPARAPTRELVQLWD